MLCAETHPTGWSAFSRAGGRAERPGVSNAEHPGSQGKPSDGALGIGTSGWGSWGNPGGSTKPPRQSRMPPTIRGLYGKGRGKRLHANRPTLGNQGLQDDLSDAHPSLEQLEQLEQLGLWWVAPGRKVPLIHPLERESPPRFRPSGWRGVGVFSWPLSQGNLRVESEFGCLK